MLRASVGLELAQLSASDAVAGQHSPNCVLDHKGWLALAEVFDRAVVFVTDPASEEHVLLALLLLARKGYFVRIDDDDKITSVRVGGVGRLVATTQNVSDFNSQATKDFISRVDYIPFGLNFALFCQIALRTTSEPIPRQLARQ